MSSSMKLENFCPRSGLRGAPFVTYVLQQPLQGRVAGAGRLPTYLQSLVPAGETGEREVKVVASPGESIRRREAKGAECEGEGSTAEPATPPSTASPSTILCLCAPPLHFGSVIVTIALPPPSVTWMNFSPLFPRSRYTNDHYPVIHDMRCIGRWI